MLNLVLTHDVLCTSVITCLMLHKQANTTVAASEKNRDERDDYLPTAMHHGGYASLLMCHLLSWRLVEDSQFTAQVMPEGASLAANVKQCYLSRNSDPFYSRSDSEKVASEMKGVSFVPEVGSLLQDPLLQLFP